MVSAAGMLFDFDAAFATIGNVHAAVIDIDVTTTSNVASGEWSAWGRL